ncbi:MAG: NUDIX hydrolase [Verrucomicrobiia bacterium]|jgi:isopentenyl-diphosphate delta-isomerase type 1
MSEEIYNVVDENDAVIGSAPRSEIHRLGLKHRAVHILIFNSSGEVFLQKRSMKKDRSPGVWDSSASGHVDRGETYDDAAMRELKEELGITGKIELKKRLKLNASPETDNEFVWVYTGLYEGEFNLNKDEISYGKWFHPKQIEEHLISSPHQFSDSFIAVWKICGDQVLNNLDI